MTALGVLCCFALFVCLTLLASFFLPSHLSFKNMYILGLVFGVIGRALCLQYRVSWVRVPPEAAHFFLGKVTALGVLCCFALFVSFFLPSHLSFNILGLVFGVIGGFITPAFSFILS